MAGTLKSNVQLGDSATATQNFTITADAANGTMRLARGNAGATTQDILTVDAAGVASLLGQQIYSRGNIRGTVSQSAGVPTGAVIERGSNANGEYVRFADGTQICTLVSAVNASVAAGGFVVYSWVQPAAFATLPVTSGALTFNTLANQAGNTIYGMNFNYGSDYLFLQTGQNSSLTGPSLTTGTAAAQSYIFRLMAIGRWF